METSIVLPVERHDGSSYLSGKIELARIGIAASPGFLGAQAISASLKHELAGEMIHEVFVLVEAERHSDYLTGDAMGLGQRFAGVRLFLFLEFRLVLVVEGKSRVDGAD